MDLQHYQEFQRLLAEGRRPEASSALQRFIASFTPDDDRRAWVRSFLESGDFGHRIRHELYEHLIFPVLLDGYRRSEVWSTFWLAKTAQNLYASAALHAQIEYRSEQQLLREAYELEPENAGIRKSLLGALLRWFAYCQHEWPTGILFGVDGATPEECKQLLEEVSFARTLDVDAENEPFLREFEQRIRNYQQRLRAA